MDPWILSHCWATLCSTKGEPHRNPIGHWGPDQEDAFQKLELHLGEALALALLDITRPFHLYIHEKGGVGLGVLTQPLGHGTGH
jgi:hypothetical protein